MNVSLYIRDPEFQVGDRVTISVNSCGPWEARHLQIAQVTDRIFSGSFELNSNGILEHQRGYWKYTLLFNDGERWFFERQVGVVLSHVEEQP